MIFVYMQREGLKNVGVGYSISYAARPKSRDYLKDTGPFAR